MHVLVTGASGLIGSALVRALTDAGDRVTRAVRSTGETPDNAVRWDPATGAIDEAGLDRLDAVVHLAGENIAGRWTAARKRRIRDSRVNGTRLLCEALAGLARPPDVLVAASAIGFYGDRGDERLTENSERGSGFLPQLCNEWEAATAPMSKTGTRVVNLRIGVVLTPDGGALAKMLTPFRLGLGGRIGSGHQYMSWIALDDLVGSILHALHSASLSGPVNAVAPGSVTNREFTRTLGRVLGRPTLFPVPGVAARLVFGEMANELLLAGARVEPVKLLETRFTFRFADLEPALRYVLGRL